MSMCGEWGDEMTLRGAATCFNVNIEVLNDRGNRNIFSPDNQGQSNQGQSNTCRTIHLGHIVERHYVSLVPSGNVVGV